LSIAVIVNQKRRGAALKKILRNSLNSHTTALWCHADTTALERCVIGPLTVVTYHVYYRHSTSSAGRWEKFSPGHIIGALLMPWGISPNASEKEKIKAESADYLNGLNSTGAIDYSLYCEAFDFYHELLDRMFNHGKSQNSSESGAGENNSQHAK
jgi:hypothetical protein